MGCPIRLLRRTPPRPRITSDSKRACNAAFSACASWRPSWTFAPGAEGGLLTHFHLFGPTFGVTHEQTGKNDAQSGRRPHVAGDVRFQAEIRHSGENSPTSAFDPKQTIYRYLRCARVVCYYAVGQVRGYRGGCVVPGSASPMRFLPFLEGPKMRLVRGGANIRYPLTRAN